MKMAKALEPLAKVRMGQWLEGPDGRREVDVEVRRTTDDLPFFLLIECKDWKVPVDIEEIDKLHSKSRDLVADRVMICSNSGFTKKALPKAARLEIEAVSVLAAGNSLIKLHVDREYVAKALSVDQWSVDLFTTEDEKWPLPESWDPRNLYYEDLPVVNWFHQISADLLRHHDGTSTIVATFAFRKVSCFKLHDHTIKLRGLRLRLTCSRKWLSQTVREDVSLGLYDWIRGRLTVPHNEAWSIGWFDQNAWEQIAGEPEDLNGDLAPGTFRLNMTLVNPIARIAGCDSPEMDDLVLNQATTLGL